MTTLITAFRLVSDHHSLYSSGLRNMYVKLVTNELCKQGEYIWEYYAINM